MNVAPTGTPPQMMCRACLEPSLPAPSLTERGTMQMLAAVDVERSGRGMTPEAKLKHHVRTTMLFLEDDDSVSAERFPVKVRCMRALDALFCDALTY